MFCNKCGAGLRDSDRFCSRCGAPVEGFKPVGEYLEETRREPEEIYYDEKLYRDDKKEYRDSFLDRREERSHAVLVTISVLLVIIVLAAAFLILFFFMKKGKFSGMQSEISIRSDEGQGQDNGDGDIIIFQPQETPGGDGSPQGELSAGDGDSSPGGQADAVPDEGLAGGAELLEGSGQDKGTGDPDAPGNNDGGFGNPDAPENNAGTGQGEAAEDTSEENTSGQGVPNQDEALDMSRIEQIFREESTISRAEVYIYDLNHSRVYQTEGSDQPMYASALVCVPVLYTAAVKLDQGAFTLNDPVTYVNSIGGRGEAYPERKEGQSFPLSYYLTAMMSYSDNNCVNCLMDFLGLDVINETCRAAGFGSVELQRKIVAEVTDGRDNYVSAKDLAGMVRELYQGKFRNISRDFMDRYFRIDAGDGYRTVIGLAADLPADIVFLNHNGRGDTRYNEVAVIADDTCQYIISVMTGGDYGFSYEEAIEDISNYVYQSLGGGSNE